MLVTQAKSADSRRLVQMRFRPELHDAVKAAARAMDMPLAQFVRQLCIRAVERREVAKD